MSKHIEYGASVHYQGQLGEEYFAWQSSLSKNIAKFEADKFQPYLNNPKRLLDFGCGGGWLLETLDASEKAGIELNPVAREEAIKRGLNVVESVGDLKDSKFDHIISNHCLEHVPYPVEALRELRELASEGGRFVLILPLDDWRTQKTYKTDDRHHHLHTWTPQLLGNTLTEAGWTVETVSVMTSAYPPRFKAFHRLKPGGGLSRFFFYLTALLLKRRQLVAVASNRKQT